MPENRLVTLIWRLHKRSMDGQLSWEDTAKKGMYQCSFPDFVVQLHEAPSHEDPDPETKDYTLSILNQDNVVIEQVNDMQLAAEIGEPGAAYRLMGEMYAAARRTAMGTEAAIDALLKELGED